MTYDNYLAGSDPTYSNAMARERTPQTAAKPMTMQEWQAYFAMLSPEEQDQLAAQMRAQGINWGTGGGQGGDIEWGKAGGSGGLSSLMGKFGGKGKSAEGG